MDRLLLIGKAEIAGLSDLPDQVFILAIDQTAFADSKSLGSVEAEHNHSRKILPELATSSKRPKARGSVNDNRESIVMP